MRRHVTTAFLLLLLGLPVAVRAGPVEDARQLLRENSAPLAGQVLAARTRAVPTDGAAHAALGDVERIRCRLPLARAAYARALEIDAADPVARAGLAETWLLEGRPLDALSAADRGIECLRAAGRADGRVWRVKALALVELRRYDLALAAARRGAALSPYDARCAEALAAAEFRSGRMHASTEAYLRAVRLDPRTEEGNLRLGNGFGPEQDGKPWREEAHASGFAEAMAAWDRGDLEEAERCFLDLATVAPEAYKYRLGVGLCRLSLRRRQEAALGGDATALYLLLPAPEVEGLSEVVPGYDALGEVERHVVRVATAPARPVWAAIRAAGATHEVIPLEADLTDAERRQDLAGRKTFDGRWYEHLRGVAGAQGATGEEKLREAAEFAFNTFAHEFGHQVHRHGLTVAQQADVERLYLRAVRSGCCLDYYAASNVDEYFAQGYEAFVSPMKRGCLTETARHTRDELLRRDPDLHTFLWSILDTGHERPEIVAALRASAETGIPPALPEPAGR